MDSTEALDEGIIKVDVVQVKPNDGTGECLWNYTEVPSVIVVIQPMEEFEGESTEEEQDSHSLKTLCDYPKMQRIVYSPGQLGSHRRVKTQKAVPTKRHHGMLKGELKLKACQLTNVQGDMYQSYAHKKPFECPICKARYSHNPSLIRHKRIHSGERPFVCSICKKDFVHNASLVFHMRTHTGEKPFECSVCNKRFSQNGTLTVHLRTHTGEQPFECSICKKKFATKSQVAVHMLVHTNDKPFTCPICEKSFSRRMYLVEHLQTHTGKRPHQCSICQKGFSRKMFLAIHLRSHSNEK